MGTEALPTRNNTSWLPLPLFSGTGQQRGGAMPRFLKKNKKSVGSAPGTLVHIGEKKIDAPRIRLIDYTHARTDEKIVERIEDLYPLRDSETVSWINIDGIHDMSLIESIGTHFGIHPLTLEDIVNTGHRPKAEELDTYVYIVLKMLHFHDSDHTVSSEQVSLIVGDRYLISLQEAPGDVFSKVRQRLVQAKGWLRRRGSDYLAYALIDAIVDHYYVIMESIGERIEWLEEQLIDRPDADRLSDIHSLKREVIYFRKQVWPMRDMMARLTKGEFDIFQEQNRIFWNDVLDHIVLLSDTIESYRDILSSIQDLYLSTVSNRMNQVMKVLTVMASVFIPITFIAGVYGMNFKNMPELDWPWGYALVWIVMIALAAVMLIIFKKKRWLE
jgi:magnesium transporter